MDYKEYISNIINIQGVSKSEIKELLIVPPEKEKGDYTLPCFKLSKILKKAPALIANDIARNFVQSDVIEKTEAVNGYLNFFIDNGFFIQDALKEILTAENYGKSAEGEGKTVCIDYSSINIAKPFHIGHLSSTVIGGALYRIYKYLGYNAVGINHLGDWGTQFGKLISAYKRWSSPQKVKEGGIKELLAIYVKFHEEAEKEPQLEEEARAYFKKIENGDSEAMEIFTLFKEITLAETQKIYNRLGIKFDSYCGESFYNDKMDEVIEELKSKNLLTESEGAQVVDLDKYGMPPCLLLKADGATLYATRDIAAALYRKKTYDFYKCLYVVAYQQNLHFRQFFKVIELMGYDWAQKLEHVAFGMVSLEEGGAMSTRKGKVVFLEDVLNRCAEKSLEIISRKNPRLENKEQVAEMVGTGAVVFSALINNRIKDIAFSYDKVLNFDGETGPYMQYTCVRAKSVLEKAAEQAAFDNVQEYEAISCQDLSPLEFETVKLLGRFKDVLKDVINKNEPSLLTRHLIDTAKCFNKFYMECKILTEKEEIKRRRLLITNAALKVMETGLELLGIKVPDKM
jgi:arginyl-tRNA synthetase